MKRVNGMTLWAAFNPETGECMSPTISPYKDTAIGVRDKFYENCPIYQCFLDPLFKDEVKKRRNQPALGKGAGSD